MNSFVDDLGDAKNQLADMNRRLHELELELRRLENEREELAAAYKEAEAVSNLNLIYYISFLSTLLSPTSSHTLNLNETIFKSDFNGRGTILGSQDRGTTFAETISRVEPTPSRV